MSIISPEREANKIVFRIGKTLRMTFTANEGFTPGNVAHQVKWFSMIQKHAVTTTITTREAQYDSVTEIMRNDKNSSVHEYLHLPLETSQTSLISWNPMYYYIKLHFLRGFIFLMSEAKPKQIFALHVNTYRHWS